MIEVVILIPINSNDGDTFSPEHHTAFEAYVLSRFGGLSRLPGHVSGQWVDGGKTYVDSLITYAVAMTSILDAAKLGEVVAFAKQHYRQEAIFVRYLGIAETL